MTTKHELLDLAKQATADRGLNYGKPEDNFERIAARWRVHLKNRFDLDVAIDATSVALMCADIKLARLEHQPDHQDSWVDLAGYAACGAEIACGQPAVAKPGRWLSKEWIAAQDAAWAARTEERAAFAEEWPDSVDDGA